MSPIPEEWTEKITRKSFCELLRSELGTDPNLVVKVLERPELDACDVDVTPKVLEPRQQVAQVTSGLWVRTYEGKLEFYGELLIPGCATRKTGLEFLLTPDRDLCSPGCGIEQVHFHGGAVPSAHVHVSCDFSKIPVKRHCAGKILTTIKRLGEFAKETCTVED